MKFNVTSISSQKRDEKLVWSMDFSTLEELIEWVRGVDDDGFACPDKEVILRVPEDPKDNRFTLVIYDDYME